MIKIKKPISLKLIFRISLPLLLVYSSLVFFTYTKHKSYALEKTKQYLVEGTKHNAEKLDKELKEISQCTRSIENFIEASLPLLEKEVLFNFIEKEVSADKNNVGAGAAFFPYKFNKDIEKYAIFVHKIDGVYQISDLTETYDYVNEDWFAMPIKLKSTYWTDPSSGKTSNAWHLTVSQPIVIDEEIIGASYADISLEILSELSQYDNILNGYTFIVNDQSTFIMHPKKSFIMKESLNGFAKKYNSEGLKNFSDSMTSGKSGIKSYKDPETGEKKWAVYAPIASTNWSFAAVIPEEAILRPVRNMLAKQIAIMAIGLLFILIIIVFVAKSISKPLKKLASATAKIANGNLDIELKELDGKDEIAALGQSFNKMALDLKTYIQHLTEATRSKEAVESEMRIARQIQESLLPRIFPPFPNRKEFDLFAKNIPAKEVAGDFYDFFFLNEDILAVVMADVSGKGISAGLFMAVTRTLLKTICHADLSPEKALEKTNDILCQDNDACMFTTLFLIYYNIKTGEISYSNAGHEYPYILSSDGECRVIKTKQNTALGIEEHHIYHLGHVTLHKKEILCLYTDGVTEATSSENKLYGKEKFKLLLSQNSDNKLDAIIDRIYTDVMEFQSEVQFDDITMLLLKRN